MKTIRKLDERRFSGPLKTLAQKINETIEHTLANTPQAGSRNIKITRFSTGTTFDVDITNKTSTPTGDARWQ